MASDTDQGDDLAYLHPDFDRNSLTVPRLRSILVNHDVPYPASAKKAQLIALLESDVLPRAKKLLRERERVRRTSKGITNMPSNNNDNNSQETPVPPGDEEEDEKQEGKGKGSGDRATPVTPSSTTARRARSSRPSTRASTATSIPEVDDATPPPPTSMRSSRQRSSRTPVVQKHPRASDTEEAGEDLLPSIEQSPRKTPARKSRKSEMTVAPHPAAIHRGEAVHPDPRHGERESSGAFTDDNPFQSGSSPLADETPRTRTGTSSEGRRRSSKRPSETTTPAAVAASKEERRRRKTADPVHVKQEDGVQVPSRSTFEVTPVSRGRDIKAEDESDEEESAEELTQDEHEELDEGYPGSTASRPGSSGSFASWIVILTLLGAFAAWWRQEKVDIGYCGVGKPRWSLVATNVPDWADAIEPRCEPCPQHAFCYPNFEVKCEPDFVLKPHPLALAGLVPVPPTCEPDGEKVRRVKVVADKAIQELRERRTKWECGEPEKEKEAGGGGDGEVPSSPELTVSELKEQVNKLRRKGMSDEEFEELWRGAMGEVAGREEVVSSTKG